MQEADVVVRAAPVDPPSVAADEAILEDDDLVLGLVMNAKPIAYPIRYLALSEVVNDTFENTNLAATW